MLNKNVASSRNICEFLFERDNRPQLGDWNGCGTVVLMAGDSLRSYGANLQNVCILYCRRCAWKPY